MVRDSSERVSTHHAELLLIGGGHTHAIALVRWIRSGFLPSNGRRVTLVSPSRYTPYSGMLPGLIQGYYRYEEAHIDLARLADRSGISFIESAATELWAETNEVELEDGRRIRGTVVSFDIGSVPRLSELPGATEHLVPVKPWSRFLSNLDRFDAEHREVGTSPVTIIGGGAGGVEVAFALLARFGPAIRLTLVQSGARLLGSGHPAGLGDDIAHLLRKLGATVLTDTAVAEVGPRTVTLAGGIEIESALTIATTDACAAGFLGESEIRTDERGFILTSNSLQSISHPTIFASGDIGTMAGSSFPKAGVYAVRQGPILARNLLAHLDGAPVDRLYTRKSALALLGTATGSAYLSWGPVWFRHPFLWRLKEKIDRRFMEKFQV